MEERENIRERLKKHKLSYVWLIGQLALRGIVTDKTEMSSVISGTRNGTKADAIIELSIDMQFRVPYREVKPIVSNAGKEVTNPMQALGSSITYLRRYLWMAVLDITEPDDIDANLGSDDQAEEEEIPAPNPETAKKEKKKKSAAPATPKEREEAKKEMTGTDGQADELQIKALKEACKTLMDKDSDQEEFVQQIAMKTNGFTNVTRAACEQLIQNLGEMIAAYGE